jgi:hypothetical protein
MRKFLLAGALLLAILSIPVLAQKVKVHFDKKTDFSRYKTYSWDQGMPAIQPEADRFIMAAIDMILAGRGWKKVEADPDVHVVYYASQDASTAVDTNSYGYGAGDWYWRGMPGAATPAYSTYRKGTLVVDIVDLQTKQMVWRAAATETLVTDRDEMIKRFNKIMDKMWKGFPPGVK